MTLIIDFSVILILIAGIWLFREPRKAKFGNLTAAFALLCALILVLFRHGVVDIGTVVMSLSVGAVAGYALSRSVSMIQIPAMVAFQNGAGGAAALLVSLVELTRGAHSLDSVSVVSGVLGLAVGSLTFSGSMIASAKLAGKIRQAPQILPFHNYLVLVVIAMLTAACATSFYVPNNTALYLYLFQIVLSAVLGVLFSIRVGGADMPVLISFLNAMTGMAAALCGMVIGNRLLIVFGATVAASGTVLTHLMCKAMNRNIIRVIWPPLKDRTASPKRNPITSPFTAKTAPQETAAGNLKDDLSTAVEIIKKSKKVIIIPGYGMALAKAQQEVAALANKMVSMSKEVKYAIHPVAGRMPGHMNVLLAEAGVDYDMLVEMEHINSDFPDTDLALVIGACDVVNPAAIDSEGTPISGMPILMAYKAKHVICCNFDKKPGYSGVENPLYQKKNTITLLGDAKKSVHQLLDFLTNGISDKSTVKVAAATNISDEAAKALADAKQIVIIPGYGMALAKAQFKVAELATLLKRNGTRVKFAIHPVAGRMPGHMNVILAEAEVDYDDLLEMDDVNPLFAETDAALIIGACDVVNPAAIEQEGTPISGMPILMAHEAKSIVVCNLDEKPGYSGVTNPLYENSKTILMLGDAKDSITDLISSIKSMGA